MKLDVEYTLVYETSFDEPENPKLHNSFGSTILTVITAKWSYAIIIINHFDKWCTDTINFKTTETDMQL